MENWSYSHEGGVEESVEPSHKVLDSAWTQPKSLLEILRTLHSSVNGDYYLGEEKELSLIVDAIRLVKGDS